MSFNNIFLLQDLDRHQQRRQTPSVFRPTPRKQLRSECCLPAKLPSLSALEKAARTQIPHTEVKQLRHRSTSSEGSSSSASSDIPTSSSQPRADDTGGYTPQKRPPPTRPKAWKEPEHWEVVQAIEKRDVVRLSEMRDHSFHVLLRRVNNTSPLEHAMRIGHTDMAVLILGMFSRWINYLEEEDFARKKVMINLNAIRVNLRFAITQGLQHNQPNLISSYLQTIVMSHGETWLRTAISDVARELNQGSEGRPAQTAIMSIKNFFTRELAKADSIVTVDAYVANAGCDLLMLGAWTLVMQKLPNAKPIPLHFFARDDRIYQEFSERRRRLRDECRVHLPKKLQWQMKVMKKASPFQLPRMDWHVQGQEFGSNARIEKDVISSSSFGRSNGPNALRGTPRQSSIRDNVPQLDPTIGFRTHPPPLQPAMSEVKLTFNPDVIMSIDPWLEPNLPALSERRGHFDHVKHKLLTAEGSYDKLTRGYEKFGLNVQPDNSVIYNEWAPNAVEASLIGDFNGWDRGAHKMSKDQFGVWSVTVPSNNGACAIPHDSKIKISMVLPHGERIERLPVWIKRVTQDLAVSPVYDARFWNPPAEQTYKFKHPRPPKVTSARIYEAHVGISSPEPRVATYKEFTVNVLPRIKNLGYNVIQLMAVMEHAYYASFGYQVTSFFAASSRYGTPDELKELIDTAHSMGITVLLDVVHSHACKNVLDGLNQFDGTDHLYFHGGGRGYHDLWDSRLFNYSHHEVLRFLLSNLRFWMEEYHFDGFRFDGVTSMMYVHHGIGTGFSGGYHEYFGPGADNEAIVYLMIANDMLHELYPDVITIAEDVSGMPLLCVTVEKGGVGFDYRLAMAVPDMWIKLLKEQKDDDWNMDHITHTLTNRRYREKTISYAESHDQALVGDKTLAFWLMDKEMYDFMSDMSPMTPIIERGLALHKMIRLLSHTLGGEGYLNFEGNEFGHPEWLDFPRAGNGNSYWYARRQFNVVDDPLLRYKYLNNFDSAMNNTEETYGWLNSDPAYVSLKNQDDKVIVFERKGLVFAFNFNPTQSFADYRIGVDNEGKYKPVLTTDEKRFAGHDRIDYNTEHFTTPLGWNNRRNWMHIYLPSRTAVVYAKFD